MPEIPLSIKTGESLSGGINPKKTVFLAENEKILDRIELPYDHIQDVLRSEIGATLPSDLVAQLGYRDLRWQLVHHVDTLPLFFIGAKDTSDERIALADAIGTIVIERIPNRQGDNRVSVNRIWIAGVTVIPNGGPRVIAVSFDHNGEANELGISTNEFLPALMVSPEDQTKFRQATSPFLKAFPFASLSVAGIVTQAMVRAAGHEYILRAQEHFPHPADQIILNLGDEPTMGLPGRTLTELNGFRLDLEHSVYTIKHTGWKANLPRFMTK